MRVLSDEVLVKQLFDPATFSSGTATTDFANLDRAGFDKCLLVANVGTANDSDTTLIIELMNSAANPASDLISSGTFSWTITIASSDDNECYLCDIDFGHIGATHRYIHPFAAVAINAADTMEIGLVAHLYDKNGPLPVTQTNTVKNELT